MSPGRATICRRQRRRNVASVDEPLQKLLGCESGSEKMCLQSPAKNTQTVRGESTVLANSMVKRCRTGDLMPNVPVSCLPSSRVDLEVQGLKFKVQHDRLKNFVIINPEP